MPSVYTITQMRQRRRKLQRSSSGRFGPGCSGALALFLALFGIFTALGYSRVTHDLPTIESLPSMLEPPDGALLQPTRLVDREGMHALLELKNPAGNAGQYLRLPSNAENQDPFFSQALLTATIAAADPGFWSHAGFSPVGIFSSGMAGHTTLAQRLVSDLLLADEPYTFRRALRERLLAAQITRRFGREKVLEWYLNYTDYGRLAFGADSAAWVYLGKSAADVDLAEAALLAGAGVNSTQNPHDAPQEALVRQKQIIDAALRFQLVDPLAAAQAAQQVVQILPVENPGQALSIEDLAPTIDPAFLAIALQQARTQISLQRLLRGGLIVYTTLDYDLQQQAECALAVQIGRLDAAQAGPSAAINCPAGRLLPALDIETRPSLAINAQALVLDPQSGQILALASGRPPTNTSMVFNWGLDDGAEMDPPGTGSAGYSEFTPLPARPIGTLGTPWIYLTAFTRGLSPASLTWDISGEDETESGEPEQGPLRLRIAMANDRMRPARQILDQVGAQNVWQTARQFGLAAPENPESTETPGPETLFRPYTLLELSQAYGVLANEGVLAGRNMTRANTDAGLDEQNPPPLYAPALLRVDDNLSRKQVDWSGWQTRPIIAPQIAYMVTNVLSDETARWPSLGRPNPLEIGRPAAAKLGHTLEGNDAWALGYTHDRVVGVWIGLPTDADAPPEWKARLPLAGAGLYHALMKYAHQALPVRPWSAPEGVITVRVCDPSGLLPTAFCPNVVDEVFLEANRPVQADRLYRSVKVNRETGRLATIFTPLDLVEDQPYLQVPPQAARWARASGQKTPPEVYDTVDPSQRQSADVQIRMPSMFTMVRGQVDIGGSITLENLDFYRIQVGQGMYPQSWIQIGEDRSAAPQGESLGEWDTSGLSGLYAIEVMAVDKDGSVQRAATLVSVDNVPPRVQITAPAQQEEISKQERAEIVLLAEVEDDMDATEVEMFMDGWRLMRWASHSTADPFAFLWICTPGEHTLRVVAIDQAGNVTEASTSFKVVP